MTARSPGPLRSFSDRVPRTRSPFCPSSDPAPVAPRAALARGLSSMECGNPAAADGRSKVTPRMILKVPHPSRLLRRVGSHNPTSTRSLLAIFVGSPAPSRSRNIRPLVILSARRLRAKDLNPRILSPTRSTLPQPECAAGSCWCRAPEGILLFVFHPLMTPLSNPEVLP